ncbi:MAG: DUF58 domain-containing protein [Chloroflexi bacterium]|nr:DUF58 domain-containing protein [Chloroflexota bacterium]
MLLALATGFPLLTRLFYVLVLTLAGGYLWAWLNLRRLEVKVDRRALRVHVGQRLDERITVRNKGWLAKSWLEVVELSDLQEYPPGKTISLASNAFRSWRTNTPAKRRGAYQLGPLRIATGDPLGLFHIERYYAGTQQIFVLPAVVPLQRFFVPSADLLGEDLMRQRSYQVTPHAATVRDYLPGDGVGRVHWPSSARLGKLMVKEFDAGLTSEVWILVDMEAAVQIPHEDDATDELAVTAASSIARHLLKARQPVGVALSGKELLLLHPDRSIIQDARILDLLALAKADGTTSLAEAIARVDPRLNRHSSLVVITASTSDQWIPGMRMLGYRGVRPVAVLVDGESFGGKDSPRALLPALSALGVPAYLVRRGEDLTKALSQPAAGQQDGFAQDSTDRDLLLKGASR